MNEIAKIDREVSTAVSKLKVISLSGFKRYKSKRDWLVKEIEKRDNKK